MTWPSLPMAAFVRMIYAPADPTASDQPRRKPQAVCHVAMPTEWPDGAARVRRGLPPGADGGPQAACGGFRNRMLNY